MRVRAFLIVDDRGHVEVRKRQPQLAVGEVSVHMEMEIPDGYFERPVLGVSFSLPDKPEPQQPPVIDMKAIQEAIETASGMEVKVKLLPHEIETDSRQ